MLATATWRTEQAAGHFENAIAITARMDARPWLAHAQDEYARMLLARGAPGDRESAHDLLRACASAFRELGMDRWAERRRGLDNHAFERVPAWWEASIAASSRS